jgi:hypothetical protein
LELILPRMTNNSKTKVRAKVSSLKQSEIIFPYLRKYEALAKKLQDNLERGQNGLPLLSFSVADIVQTLRIYN